MGLEPEEFILPKEGEITEEAKNLWTPKKREEELENELNSLRELIKKQNQKKN